MHLNFIALAFFASGFSIQLRLRRRRKQQRRPTVDVPVQRKRNIVFNKNVSLKFWRVPILMLNSSLPDPYIRVFFGECAGGGCEIATRFWFSFSFCFHSIEWIHSNTNIKMQLFRIEHKRIFTFGKE